MIVNDKVGLASKTAITGNFVDDTMSHVVDDSDEIRQDRTDSVFEEVEVGALRQC